MAGGEQRAMRLSGLTVYRSVNLVLMDASRHHQHGLAVLRLSLRTGSLSSSRIHQVVSWRRRAFSGLDVLVLERRQKGRCCQETVYRMSL